MNGLEFIKSKQQNWAKRKGFELVGGTIPNKGEKNYLCNLADNLFEPLSKENLKCYNSGDGNETKDSKTRLAKMKALHSSSAIVVNLFQYWQEKDVCSILKACKLTSRASRTERIIENISSDSPKETPIISSPLNYKIKFEEKFEISDDKSQYPHSPNIDVVIYTPLSEIAIESKFSEPYSSRKHSGLKQKYVENPTFWKGLSNLHKLAQEISPDDNKFLHLDAAQLIKHILGLRKSNNKKNFHLLYLWYDVIGKEGVEHRKEIDLFAEIAQKDNIKFSHITYQEVISTLARGFYEGNENYCNYLTDRYL